MINSRRLRWEGHLTRMEEGGSAFKILTGIPTKKRPLVMTRADEKTLLEWTLNKQVSIRGIELIRLSIAIIGEPL